MKKSISNTKFSTSENGHIIRRRGVTLGFIEETFPTSTTTSKYIEWSSSHPLFLPKALSKNIGGFDKEISQTEKLITYILEGNDPSYCFDSEYYQKKLAPEFEVSTCLMNESDDQELVKITFNQYDDQNPVHENIWCKLAWLSLSDEDPSLRFRFSYGIEDYEDVAANDASQIASATVCERLFGESKIITANQEIHDFLKRTLDTTNLKYVERIIYFNAPNGGAQFHHDVERGHAGVIYAQVTGQTFWFALPFQLLVDEILEFFPNLETLKPEINSRESLVSLLKDRSNTFSETLIDQNSDFFKHLVSKGHGFLLNPGDVLLLPQISEDNCCWHSVSCVGEEIGEGLSFAIKAS